MDNLALTLPHRSLSPSLQSASSFGDYSDSERSGPPKFFKSLPSRVRESRDLLQCPTIGCDGMGHVSGNYATRRRSVAGVAAVARPHLVWQLVRLPSRGPVHGAGAAPGAQVPDPGLRRFRARDGQLLVAPQSVRLSARSQRQDQELRPFAQRLDGEARRRGAVAVRRARPSLSRLSSTQLSLSALLLLLCCVLCPVVAPVSVQLSCRRLRWFRAHHRQICHSSQVLGLSLWRFSCTCFLSPFSCLCWPC